MKISGAIFDMDGTLLDSMFVWDNIGTKFIEAAGGKARPELEADIDYMSMDQVIEYMKNEYKIVRTGEQVREGINALVYPIYQEKVGLKPGVLELLENFSQRGIKMCIATATDHHIAKMILEKNNILHYFSELFTCSLVGASKDKPTIYEVALAHLGTEKATTFVFEDALYAIKTAKAAGFPVVGIFDEHSSGHQPEVKSISDIYVTDYRSAQPYFA